MLIFIFSLELLKYEKVSLPLVNELNIKLGNISRQPKSNRLITKWKETWLWKQPICTHVSHAAPPPHVSGVMFQATANVFQRVVKRVYCVGSTGLAHVGTSERTDSPNRELLSLKNRHEPRLLRRRRRRRRTRSTPNYAPRQHQQRGGFVAPSWANTRDSWERTWMKNRHSARAWVRDSVARVALNIRGWKASRPAAEIVPRESNFHEREIPRLEWRRTRHGRGDLREIVIERNWKRDATRCNVLSESCCNSSFSYTERIKSSRERTKSQDYGNFFAQIAIESNWVQIILG